MGLITATYSGLLNTCETFSDISAFEGKSREVIEGLDQLWGNTAGNTQGGFCNGDCDANLQITTTCKNNPDGTSDITLDFVVNNLA